MHSPDDTIAAIATAAGGAARGIVRISGPGALACIQCCFQPSEPGAWNDSDRRARVLHGTVRWTSAGGFVAQAGRCPLPVDLYLWPTSRSYTRQPVAELHTLGSPPLLEALLREVCSAGARIAEPGEFTLRAFLAGRLDLVEAEAVLGVIDAQSGRELDLALAQLAGGLTRPLTHLRDTLLDLLAELEAGLDFAEERIEFIAPAELQRRLDEAATAIGRLVQQMTSRGRSDAEPRVVLIGSPNVGKSSLFNAMAGDAAALVSDRPGTTRDYLTARIPLGDMSCILVDTAGMESPIPVDPLSDAAKQAAVEQHERADLWLLCLEATRPPNAWEQIQLTACPTTGGDSPIFASAAEQKGTVPLAQTVLGQAQNRDAPRIVVWTKCDAVRPSAIPTIPGHATSSLTGSGIGPLRDAIRERLEHCGSHGLGEPSAVAATAARCRDSLRLAAECLERARDTASAERGDELVAAEIRSALVELGQVVGVVYTDDLLDRIFSRFCIGK